MTRAFCKQMSWPNSLYDWRPQSKNCPPYHCHHLSPTKPTELDNECPDDTYSSAIDLLYPAILSSTTNSCPWTFDAQGIFCNPACSNPPNPTCPCLISPYLPMRYPSQTSLLLCLQPSDTAPNKGQHAPLKDSMCPPPLN